MHLSRRFQSVRLRRNDLRKASLPYARENPFGPERRLERRNKLAVMQFGLGIAQLVVFGIDDTHFRSCSFGIGLRRRFTQIGGGKNNAAGLVYEGE
jgi:hypothetical protein